MTKIKLLVVVVFVQALALHAAKEFVYNRDGFSFYNYTNQNNPVNLTPANVERLCGHVSCIRGTGNSCVLRAPMQKVQQELNDIMDGGHCEGFAALAEGIFTGEVPLKSLDAKANSTFALKSTAPVQAEIAYWFSTQLTSPTHPSKIGDLLPNQALNILRNAKEDQYAMQMYNPRKKPGEPRYGHTIKPFKVIDDSPDQAKIAVSDSNHPNMTMLIFVDKKKNTWHYEGFPLTSYPEKKAMILVPFSARLEQQSCPWTGWVDQPAQKVKPKQMQTPQVQPPQVQPPQVQPKQQAQPQTKHPEVWPKGTEPQWVEEDNNQSEYEEYEEPEWVDIQANNDGVRFDFETILDIVDIFLSGSVKEIRIPDTKASSIYQVPVGKDRRFHLLEGNLRAKKPTNLYIMSRGQAMTIEGIKPYKGQNDEVFLGEDGETITYSTKSSAPVTLTIAESLKDGDYTIKIKPTVKAGGFDVRLHNIIDKRYGFHELELALSNHDKSVASYAIEMTRMTQDGDATFTHNNREDLKVEPGEVNTIEYGQWHNDKETLTVVDKIAGEVEKSLQISDEQ